MTPITTASASATKVSKPVVVTPTTLKSELVEPQQFADKFSDDRQRVDDVPNSLPAFQDLYVSPEELRPSATLTTGQCFHWKVLEENETQQQPKSAWGSHNATEWLGTLRDSSSGKTVVVVIRETSETTMFRVIHAPEGMCVKTFLRNYFQLDENLKSLYQSWSQQDQRLARIAQCIPGVRIIDQDPWECLISFICSRYGFSQYADLKFFVSVCFVL